MKFPVICSFPTACLSMLLGMMLVTVSGCDYVKSQRENERIAERMAELCANEAGVYAYKTVVIPDALWDFKNNYRLDDALNFEDTPDPTKLFEFKLWTEDLGGHVYREHSSVYDQATGELILDKIYFIGANVGSGFGFREGRGRKTCRSNQKGVIRQLPANLQNRPEIIDPNQLYTRAEVEQIIMRPESQPLY